MPSKSAKQKHFMQAAAHNSKFAKKAGIPQSVAKKFVRADKGIAEDKIPGGRDAKDLAAFLSRFDFDEVAKGIKVEMEHTDDRETAKEIASDHLDEDPHYYSKLAKVHKESVMNKTPYFNNLHEDGYHDMENIHKCFIPATPYFNSLHENLDAMASDHAQLAQRLRGQIEGASAWLQHITKYQGKIEVARKKENETKKKADQAKKKAEKKQAKAKKK